MYSFYYFPLLAKPASLDALTLRTFKKALYCIHVAALGKGSGKVSNLFKSM